MGGAILFGIHNPDFRAGFESSMYVKGVSVNSYVEVLIVMLLLMILMSIAAFLICREVTNFSCWIYHRFNSRFHYAHDSPRLVH